jgi:hypothetical protein
MGLDMYLHGRKNFFTYDRKGPEFDGYPIDSIELALGYWRKHPNLHGFIVSHFGTIAAEEQIEPKEGEMDMRMRYEQDDGKVRIDDCEDIELDGNALKTIIEAVQKDQLPPTSGFFFGESYTPGDAEYEAQKKEDLEILGKALFWLSFTDDGKTVFQKVVIYRASW